MPVVTVVNCCSGWSKHVAALPPRKRAGAQPLRESLSVGLAARYLEPTQHRPPPLARYGREQRAQTPSIYRPLTDLPSSAPHRPPRHPQPVKRVCQQPVLLALLLLLLLHRPPALVPFPCASTLIKRHFISNLTCDPQPLLPSPTHSLSTPYIYACHRRHVVEAHQEYVVANAALICPHP